MKPVEAFRVAVIADMKTASLVSISKACERARRLVLKILEPLRLGGRLELGFSEDAHARGWLVIRIIPSGQQALFAERDLPELLNEDLETASARQLLREWLARLKKVMHQCSISGFELESTAADMPDIKEFYAALSIKTPDRRRTLIQTENSAMDDFELSQLPGRHLGKPVQITVWIHMIGEWSAYIRLPRPARPVVRATREPCLLRWDRHSIEQPTWNHLLISMREHKPVQVEVKGIYRSSGTLVELLLVKLLPLRADALQETVGITANEQIVTETVQ
jgi:hypothetical protein